jgi:hypothetical protein
MYLSSFGVKKRNKESERGKEVENAEGSLHIS